MPNRLYIHFLRLPLILRILIIALLVFLAFGVIIHLLEPETFPSTFEGIWWAIITASTVGYGDYVPQSFLGRLTALFLILIGVGVVSSYFGTLAAVAVTKEDAFSEGKIPFKGVKHIIIIGWNERSKELIQKLTRLKNPNMVVLIDETLEANPVKSKFVHFIQGKGHVDETIIKSDIQRAEKVLITADRGSDELQADMNSILTLLTIKGLCPQVKCIVEILTSEQVINAKRAGADEIIQSNKLTSVFMLNSIHTNGEGLLSNILEHLQEDQLSSCLAGDKQIGKSFSEISLELQTKSLLLIGIQRGDETLLYPSPSYLIEKNDHLLVLRPA